MTASLAAPFTVPDIQPLPPELTQPHHDEHRKELELAVAAGLLAAFTVVRDRLRSHSHDQGDPRERAGQVWREHEPMWKQLLMPALLEAWRAHRLEAPIPNDAAQLLAGAYSEALGSYVEATSAEAFAAGVQRQIDTRIEPRLAWERAAAAYGLDLRDMRGYVTRLASLLTTPQDQVVPPAAKVYIDRATLVRVDLIGRSEAWTSMQTLKSLAWAAMEKTGQLPPGVSREWDTAEDEATCPTCAPLDGTRVPVAEPFRVAGRPMLAPQAHPGCRCIVRLFVPEFLRKAWGPEDEKQHPRGNPVNAGRFAPKAQKAAPKKAAPRARVAEKVRTADPAVEAMVAQAQALAAQERQVATDVEEGLKLAAPVEQKLALNTSLQLSQPLKLSSLSFSSLSLSEPKLAEAPTEQLALGLQLHQDEPDPLALDLRRPTPRKVLIVALPPEKKKEPQPDELHMSANDWAMAMGHTTDGRYVDGEVINFAAAQSNARFGLRAYNSSPWYAPDPNIVFLKRNMERDGANRDLIEEQWREACALAHPLWKKVIRNPQPGFKYLSDNELRDIMRTGGQFDTHEIQVMERADMIDAIKQDVSNLDLLGEASTAEAYADHLVWKRPEVLGPKGRELDKFLEGGRGMSINLADYPPEEVFSFSPQDARDGDIRGPEIRPSGDYQIAGHTYKSALNDFGVEAPSLHVGIVMNHMTPIYVQRGSWGPKKKKESASWPAGDSSSPRKPSRPW